MDSSTLLEIQNLYLAALALDAVNPKPDYSLDGQTVSRAAWRDGMWSKVEKISQLIQWAEPFELRGYTP